ncbi:AEC family transporter [Paenibacillus sp. MMS20-IR301]|uniref:AEC family transporter n=1 Tax=Paenibacillus sp. MMS20-IR301 TaxID=2895946 RepID=UPI0028EEFC66|nr:AEC family transporter [Paenibacillus sp. MMS20-IR301]WNS45471.1 AEC family transporter [Paenibacillus sp. MMS20-IR301]
MLIFTTILLNNVIPLFIVILLGAVLYRAFKLDIKTLSKLNFYMLTPAVVFQLLYGTEISFALFGQIILFFCIYMLLQYAVLEVVIRVRGLKGGMPAALRNSVLFANSANYGLPINQLAFSGNPLTLAVQVVILTLQSFLPNTYGIYSVNAHRSSLRTMLRTIAGQPVIYAIPLALIMRGLDIPLPGFLAAPISYVANTFIGLALITLGVQLGSMKWSLPRGKALDLTLSVTLRLLAGPAVAALTLWALGMDGLVAKALIVSSAVPTSLSSVLLAVEFDNEPEFSSQAVFFSTLLSTLTVTGVIMLVNV